MGFDQIVQLIAAAGSVFIFISLFIFYLQWRATVRETDTARLFQLVMFLNSNENHSSRKHVFDQLQSGYNLPLQSDDSKSASRVCASYDTAGFMIRGGFVEAETIMKNYGPSIDRCYEILEPFIEELRERMGPRYWDDFTWLCNQVRDRNYGVTRK